MKKNFLIRVKQDSNLVTVFDQIFSFLCTRLLISYIRSMEDVKTCPSL